MGGWFLQDAMLDACMVCAWHVQSLTNKEDREQEAHVQTDEVIVNLRIAPHHHVLLNGGRQGTTILQSEFQFAGAVLSSKSCEKDNEARSFTVCFSGKQSSYHLLGCRAD